MARTIRRGIEIILMLAGLLALPVAWMQYRDGESRHAAEPPWSVRTLDDFRKWRPQYDQALRIESAGPPYYLVLGEKARMLASGPSGYVFDARGLLVGWILDTGDDTYLRVTTGGDSRKISLRTREIVINAAAVDQKK